MFVSPESQAGFAQELGSPVDSEVIPNPINVERVQEWSQQPLPEEAIGTYAKEHCDITVVGRLVPVKALDRLITVVQRLRAEGVRLDLHIVGDGQEREGLQALADNADNIHFHGYQSNPYPFITASDLFMIPSHAEGFSTVMLESLLLGVATMSTKVSGSSFLEPQQVIRNDEASITQALRSFATDYDFAREIDSASERGQTKALHMVKANLQRIESLLNGKASDD